MTPSRTSGMLSKEQPLSADFEAILEAVFNKHWDPVCRFLFRLTGDWDEAEDLALETFLQYHRRPPADERQLAAWLYRVATNLGLNALRSRKRRQLYELQAGMDVLQHNSPADPARDVERRLEREKVRAALSTIRPRSAQLLMLRYSGLTYSDISAALKVAPASVGKLLARAELEFEKAFRKIA